MVYSYFSLPKNLPRFAWIKESFIMILSACNVTIHEHMLLFLFLILLIVSYFYISELNFFLLKYYVSFLIGVIEYLL